MTRREASERYAQALVGAGVSDEAAERLAQIFDLGLATAGGDRGNAVTANFDELQPTIQELEAALGGARQP